MGIGKFIFFGVIIAFAIIKEVFSARNSDEERNSRDNRPAQRMRQPGAPRPRQTPVSHMIFDEEPQYVAQPPRVQPPKVERPTPPPVSAPLPEEGQRVTRDTPLIPDPKRTNKEHKPSPLADLRDRKALRRAIIFSEVLAPKF